MPSSTVRAKPSPRGARRPAAPALSNLGLRRSSSSTSNNAGVRKSSVVARKKQKSPSKKDETREVVLKVREVVWSGAELAGAVRCHQYLLLCDQFGSSDFCSSDRATRPVNTQWALRSQQPHAPSSRAAHNSTTIPHNHRCRDRVAQVYAPIQDEDEDEDESLLQQYDGGSGTPARLQESLISAREAVSERRRALGWK